MNEENKIEIEELLNDLVDDRATDRQETEFKRLAKHDSAIVDQLAAMRWQKELLTALPIESAPASLAEDISAALERKLILGDVAESEQTLAGASHLLLRRILTTAAMLLIPLGLLSFVVFEIMKPVSPGPAVYVSTDETLAREGSGNLAAVTPVVDAVLPFDGILTFTTDRQMVVSSYIEKRIFDQGLNSFPNRTADVATYQITAPPEQIATLIGSLENVWPHCRDVSLSVADRSESYTTKISQVQAKQIRILAAEDNREMLNHLADQYARTNENKKTLFAKEDVSGLQDIGLDEYPRLAMPILAGTDDSDSPSEKAKKPDPTQPTVRLRIEIKHTVNQQ
ncbi:MAG: hypothetical protein B6I25_07055 [Planctomycetales bacterium 4572_13]|nr:MAG: hypothetical protein B6I25_07055 [Planctomycetales bacterium 4572_13]